MSENKKDPKKDINDLLDSTEAQAPTVDPKLKAAEEAAAEKALKESQRLQSKFTKYSILIAEDDTGLQDALAEAAEERGFKVYRANDGLEAVRKAQTQPFDAILIDMNLPKKLGHEAVANIRNSGPCQKSVIVVLSGYLKKEVVQALVGKIEKAYTKPADIDLVLNGVLNFVEQKNIKKTG